MDAIASSRITKAMPQRGRMAVERSVAGERAIMVGQLCCKISISTTRAQCMTLHGRLELIGMGLSEAAA